MYEVSKNKIWVTRTFQLLEILTMLQHAASFTSTKPHHKYSSLPDISWTS